MCTELLTTQECTEVASGGEINGMQLPRACWVAKTALRVPVPAEKPARELRGRATGWWQRQLGGTATKVCGIAPSLRTTQGTALRTCCLGKQPLALFERMVQPALFGGWDMMEEVQGKGGRALLLLLKPCLLQLGCYSTAQLLLSGLLRYLGPVLHAGSVASMS